MGENPKSFSKENSKHLMFLDSLTDEQIYNRYFTKGDHTDWYADFNKEWGDEKENQKYQLVKTFNPGSIGYFVSKLKLLYEPLLPVGYKFNAKSIFLDLDKVLCENRELALPARIKANQFLLDLVTEFANIIDKGLNYSNTLGL